LCEHSAQSSVPEFADAYHFNYWLGTTHLSAYTEWWYFNVYDSSNNVQAIFTYFINNPLNLSGGIFPLGVSEITAAAFAPGGIVNEADIYLTPSFSANYTNAGVQIGNQNSITVVDANTYRIAGAARDGRMCWNLLYQRTAPSWYAANRTSVAAEPWQQMSWLLYMPRAAVSGTLTIDGVAYNVNASGYHDHNWGEWDLNGVTWNWAQYSQPGLSFDLGDFPQKPGGVASLEVNGQRFVFQNGQYSLTHLRWAYDAVNKLFYPTQSLFQASNRETQLVVIMSVQHSDPLTAPLPPPRAVIYEQTARYAGHASVNGIDFDFGGNGFKEYTAIAQ